MVANRLRDAAAVLEVDSAYRRDAAIMREAADEVERLCHDIERHVEMACELATECERLRAELAERKATTPAPKPDCRTCVHYIPPLSFAGEPACEFANTESVLVCITGSEYQPADPVRLYDTARKGEGDS